MESGELNTSIHLASFFISLYFGVGGHFTDHIPERTPKGFNVDRTEIQKRKQNPEGVQVNVSHFGGSNISLTTGFNMWVLRTKHLKEKIRNLFTGFKVDYFYRVENQ